MLITKWDTGLVQKMASLPVGKLGEDARQTLNDVVTVTFPIWQLYLPRVLFNDLTFPVVLINEATLGAQAFAFQAACRSLRSLPSTQNKAHWLVYSFFNIFVKRAMEGLGLKPQLLLDSSHTRTGMSHCRLLQ